MALTQAGLVPVQPSTDELQDSRYRTGTGAILDRTGTGSILDRTGLDYIGQDRTE